MSATSATLTIRSTTATTVDNTNSATGGAGGTGTTTNGANGNGNGGGVYVGIGSNAIFNTDAANIDISGDIFSNGHITISGTGNGIVNFIGGTATHSTAFSTGTTINAGNILNGTTNSLTGPITNNGTLRFTQTTTGTFVGTVTGTGTVELAGTGRIVLANAYSGNTVINAGTLQGTTSQLLGTITNNSTLDIQQSSNGTFSGTVTGGGTVQKSGTGTVTMGNQAYTGATNVSQGGLLINGNSSSNTVSVASGSIVRRQQQFGGGIGERRYSLAGQQRHRHDHGRHEFHEQQRHDQHPSRPDGRCNHARHDARLHRRCQ
ncbi:MAG: autotransporter-associated beta strand repeat-containing protein [Pirellulales bacterium]